MMLITHLAAAIAGGALVLIVAFWLELRPRRLPSVRTRELPPATTAQLAREDRSNRLDIATAIRRPGFRNVPPAQPDFDHDETHDIDPPGAA